MLLFKRGLRMKKFLFLCSTLFFLSLSSFALDCGDHLYPTDTGHPNWTVLGDRDPDRKTVLEHILHHENHREQITMADHREWVERLNRKELMALHSDLHSEEEYNEPYVAWECIGRD